MMVHGLIIKFATKNLARDRWKANYKTEHIFGTWLMAYTAFLTNIAVFYEGIRDNYDYCLTTTKCRELRCCPLLNQGT